LSNIATMLPLLDQKQVKNTLLKMFFNGLFFSSGNPFDF